MMLNRHMALGLVMAVCMAATTGAVAQVEQAIKSLPTYKPGDDVAPLETIEQAAKAVTSGQADRLTLSNQLLGVLADPTTTVEARRFVCRQLVLVGGDEAVAPLAKLLTDDEMTHMACYALGRIQSDKASNALIGHLDQVKGGSLITLINAIGMRGDPTALARLADIAEKGEPAERAAAIYAIGSIGGADAAAKLIALAKLMRGADEKMREAYFDAALKCAEGEATAGRMSGAAELLGAIDAMAPRKVVALAVQRGRLLAAAPDELPAKLLALFAADDAELNQVAATYLRDDAKPATVTAVLAKADQLTPAAHAVAIEAAAAQKNADALPHVRKAVADDDADVRLAAIVALGDLGSSNDLPLLIKAAAGDDDSAAAARKVLVKFNATGAEQAMLAQLEKQTGQAQAALIEVVAARRMTAAAPSLLKLARAKDQAVRHAALRALGECAEIDDVDALVGLVAQPVAAEDIGVAEGAARAVFGRVGDAGRCAAGLLKHIKTATPASQVALVRLMPAAPTDATLKAVRDRVGAADETLRDAAIRALIDWRGTATAGDLRKIAEASDSRKYRVLALQGFIARTNDAKTLGEALKLAERREEKLAVLARLPEDAGGVDIAAAAMDDQSLRREAIDALIRIAEKIDKAKAGGLADPLRRAAELTTDAKTRDRINKAMATHGIKPAADNQ